MSSPINRSIIELIEELALKGGGFVISWHSDVGTDDGAGPGTVLQRFGADGAPQGSVSLTAGPLGIAWAPDGQWIVYRHFTPDDKQAA